MRQVLVALLGVMSTAAYAGPQADYLLHCGGCHLADGNGAPPEVPPLRDALGWLASIQEGRDYLVRVPGASQAPLSDADLAAVVNWVLVEFNATTIDAEFQPLTATEVGRARNRPLLDPVKLREEMWGRYSDAPDETARH